MAENVEFCRRLKNIPTTKSIPVIIVSAFEKNLSKYKFQHERLIMVVDDSRSIRLLLEDSLEKAGFAVITANNGKEALDIIKSKRPDLIISDINMP